MRKTSFKKKKMKCIGKMDRKHESEPFDECIPAWKQACAR